MDAGGGRERCAVCYRSGLSPEQPVEPPRCGCRALFKRWYWTGGDPSGILPLFDDQGGFARKADMPQAGSTLGGRYVLAELVARGGMGEVWRADDSLLGRTVAVKILLPSLSGDPGFAARFQAEARAMAALSDSGPESAGAREPASIV